MSRLPRIKARASLWSSDDRAALLRMQKAGESYQNIARQLGRTIPAVKYQAHFHGLLRETSKVSPNVMDSPAKDDELITYLNSASLGEYKPIWKTDELARVQKLKNEGQSAAPIAEALGNRDERAVARLGDKL
ncbi:hypothetical protein LTR95_012878 [Oleoguttula sp. CCFEE 5521]